MSQTTVLRGGRVLDPAQGIDKIADVTIADGKIAAIGENPDDGTAEIVDAGGLLVTPGLVDLHVHVYGSLGFSHPDSIGIDQGVTSYVEAGGPGPDTFAEFDALMADATVADLYCMLWFRPIGLVGIGHVEGDSRSLMSWKIPEWMDLVDANRHSIKYLKTAAFGDYGTGPLKLGKGLADILELPTYAHIGDFQVTPKRLTTTDAFDLASANDVVTHIYHENLGSILDEQGTVIPAVKAAQRRGVLFDIGLGAFNFSFDIAEKAIAQDVVPDILSSDLQQFNVLGPTYSLAHCMSMFLILGFSLAEIIEMVTIAPAKALGIADKAGTMGVGMPADITVLKIEQGDFEFDDCFEDSRKGDQRFVPVMAFKDGKRHDSNLESARDDRNWILQVIEDGLPNAVQTLVPEQRAFLKALAADLASCEWTDADIDLDAAEQVQHRVYAIQNRSAVSLRDALWAIYKCFLDEPFTYQIGLFLTRMNRTFALERLRAVAA